MSLQLRDVSKSFGEVQVLESISFDVAPGSRLAIVGASGSGKTTILRLIAGFEQPTAGEIRLSGEVLADASTNVGAHRRGIGYVAQDGALFPHLTVRQNLSFGLPRGQRRSHRILEVMELTSLDVELLERYPHQLSGGQQQRVALARALAPNPNVILLDEPFSALDTGLRAHTRGAMIDALERSGVTTVLVTHDQEEALSFGHRLAVVSRGRLVQEGPPSDVFDAPTNADVAEFLGAALFVPARRSDHAPEALSPFGRVPIRHDRSGGASEVRAMFRPSQLHLSLAREADGTALIESVRQSGSSIEMDVTVTGFDGLRLTHRVPLHEARGLRPGTAVSIRVEGGVVLYAGADSDVVRPTAEF